MDHPHPTFESIYPNGVVVNEDSLELFDRCRKKRQAISFDDVTLEDKPSDFHPDDVTLHSFITRRIMLKGCGIMSAAMDTVTEGHMALALAKVGGIGILHRNLDPEKQAALVKWVRKKIHYGGMVDKPITFHPDDRYSKLQKESRDHGWTFTSFPIVSEDGTLLGLLTRDEMHFAEEKNLKLSEMMKPRALVVTAPEGTTGEQAYSIMQQKKVKKLLVVDKEDRLKGMFVWGDVKKDQRKREWFSIDEEGHFLVGAAIGLGPEDMERATLLVEAGCRVLVLDSSHGACLAAKEQIARLRKQFGEGVELIVGNIASFASAEYLLKGPHRPDALKVGIGPGSICTTRVVTGHGVPQITALAEVARAVRESDWKVPLIADGGLRSSGDVVKAIAAGASGVMFGSFFAGAAESPGAIVEVNGKRFKAVRGMGSRAAMEERSGSRGRYHRQNDDEHVTEELTAGQKEKLVPEGVEGLVKYGGSVETMVFELLGGIQSGLGHSGANSIPSFHKNASMWMQSSTGILEGKPHDIQDIRQ